jgi:hypothetical protein
MKNYRIFFAVALVASGVYVARLANADESEGHKRAQKRSGPAISHQRGTPVGHNHIITHMDENRVAHEVTHPVMSDQRPLAAIHNDRTIVHVKAGFYPTGHVEHRWDHWHRDWSIYWRFNDWGRINQVTCEAVNTSNSYLYPVTAYRVDYSSGWSNDVGNQLVENALDNCYADSEQTNANPDDCVLIDWECRYL